MSGTKKAVVMTAAVLLLLGGILLILLLTQPSAEVAPVGEISAVDIPSAYVIDRRSDNVVTVRVTNDKGEFVFNRQQREDSDTSEYYWTSGDLKGVTQDDALVRNFIASLVSLPDLGTVEENAENLAKYGLENPQSTAEITFDDGTTAVMRFGIRNPVNESAVYFLMDDSRTVKLVNYYAVEGTFGEVSRFAQPASTEENNSNGSNGLESLTTSRADG